MSDPASRGPRRALQVLSLAAILASGAVGFLSYYLLVHRPSSIVAAGDSHPASTGAQGGDSEGVSERQEEPPAPKVPESLPDLQLPGTDGRRHRLTDWKGRDLLINFWATWCEPCRREIPLLKSIRRENASKNLEIVGIAIDYDEVVRRYVSEHGIDYPVLAGEREGLQAATAFGMETVLPFSVFSDRQGRVVTLKVGELHRDEAELILDRVREVDAGRLALASAQMEISEGVRKLRQARAEGPG
ncbi:MAG TPA: TlpA disulfide reductase family protein [Steroidobacteraceae bacterium]|nr:TlpA disulfide reductase family protein [Steroidobacteraceae bacterium]